MSNFVRNANYRTIPTLVRNRTPFDGNSMSAKLVGDVYEVWSYGTRIATVNDATGDRWISDSHYSRTTSRHQNICKAAL